jgi:hypothetical protein
MEKRIGPDFAGVAAEVSAAVAGASAGGCDVHAAEKPLKMTSA